MPSVMVLHRIATVRRLPVAAVLLCAAAAGCMPSANAAGPPTAAGPVLVELFTSQGCSSCPAADALVRELPQLGWGRDRVLPLTFHVDYWDGLGWKDPFASPAFTDRQRRYTDRRTLVAPEGERGISGAYTPQMIVNGAVHFSGGQRAVALEQIRRAAAAPAPATLTAQATVDGDRVWVTAQLSPARPAGRGVETGAGGARTRPAAGSPMTTATTATTPPPSNANANAETWRLMVALALKGARTRVAQGENGGETLDEADIVRVLSDPVPVTLRSEASPARVSVVRPRDLAWADVELTAFVQSSATLRVIAARAVPLPLPR